MKVKALFHVIQTVGSLSVERVKDTVFDLPETDAVAAAAQGLVSIVEVQTSKPHNAKNRQTRVVKDFETR